MQIGFPIQLWIIGESEISDTQAVDVQSVARELRFIRRTEEVLQVLRVPIRIYVVVNEVLNQLCIILFIILYIKARICCIFSFGGPFVCSFVGSFLTSLVILILLGFRLVLLLNLRWLFVLQTDTTLVHNFDITIKPMEYIKNLLKFGRGVDS